MYTWGFRKASETENLILSERARETNYICSGTGIYNGGGKGLKEEIGNIGEN